MSDKLPLPTATLPEDSYAPFVQFAKDHPQITYSAFDEASAWELNLFALRENFDFASLEAIIDRLQRDLPAIKRIFAKPIIRLKDTGAILPVESVHIVNHETVVHASAHSELWENIDEDGLLPRKLLTVQHKDHYAIYENLVFARTVRILLRFTGSWAKRLADMLYADRELHFNLLDRLDHPAYFLALGKLHIGYVRDYDKYRTEAMRCLDKLLFLDRQLRSRLGSPVYRKCKDFSGTLTLKKTNIFRMHKDYRRIYLLAKWLDAQNIGLPDHQEALADESAYGLYCSMLFVFAAGHFNFRFDPHRKMDFSALAEEATFAGWHLKIESIRREETNLLRYTLSKEQTYRILLLPTADPEGAQDQLAQLRRANAADEYHTVSVYEAEGGIRLDLHDIDSFRRIQQLLLRGMIAADRTLTVCPFCGGVLSRTAEQGGTVDCANCRTRVTVGNCPQTGDRWYATTIRNYRPARRQTASRRADLLADRYRESLWHFRNITPMDAQGLPLCPHCGKSHLS